MTPEENAFLSWFHGPKPGPYEYYRGDLAMLEPRDRPRVAGLVLRMALGNKVQRVRPQLLLAQRRHGAHDYSYLCWRA